MEVRSNRIGDIRQFYKSKLLDNYEEKEAEALLLLLIEEYTAISKLKTIADPGLTVSESELLKIHFAVKDLNNNKPVQYILGKTEFYGLKIKVSSDVLIPRLETEELVELIIKENLHKKNLRILDIGTGSGCIAIAIQKFLPDCSVVAVDVSQNAIQISKTNAKLNQVNVEFQLLDFLDESSWSRLGSFDIIVSNPPYVRQSEKVLMKRNVLDFEPEKALFVDDNNPLLFYKSIASFAGQYLNVSGKVYCEINQYLGDEVLALFSQTGFVEIEILKDLFGNNRFIKARLNIKV